MKALIAVIILLAFFSKASAQETTTINDIVNKIYTVVEKEPEFPGGKKAYYEFLSKNLKWPDKTGMIDVQGKVLVSFIVEKNGRLTNFKITRSLDSLFDTEALRVMKLSPKWHPGAQGGKPVSVAYTEPINFEIQD